MNQRPQLTVTAAVEAFNIERRTLQRLLAAGKLDGATKDNRGRWTIPVETLHAAGFPARQTWLTEAIPSRQTTRQTTRQPETPTRQHTTPPSETAENTGRETTKADATNDATTRDTDTTHLSQRIAHLEQKLETERLLKEAAERNAQDLRNAMRMLEAKPSAPPRTWWGRRSSGSR